MTEDAKKQKTRKNLKWNYGETKNLRMDDNRKAETCGNFGGISAESKNYCHRYDDSFIQRFKSPVYSDLFPNLENIDLPRTKIPPTASKPVPTSNALPVVDIAASGVCRAKYFCSLISPSDSV